MTDADVFLLMDFIWGTHKCFFCRLLYGTSIHHDTQYVDATRICIDIVSPSQCMIYQYTGCSYSFSQI